MNTSTPPPAQCPRCLGNGTTYYDSTDRRGEHITVEEECEQCEGTGRSVEVAA